MKKKILKMIFLFFLFNSFLISEELPNFHICSLKKESLKEFILLKKGILEILKNKRYLKIMDSFSIGEQINKNKYYSFSLNISSIVKELDKEIKKEEKYLNNYCSSYFINNNTYIKNSNYILSNNIFFSLNNLLFLAIKKQNYYNNNVSFIPCLLSKEYKTLLQKSDVLNKKFLNIKYFCKFLKKRYRHKKIYPYIELIKSP